MSATEYSRLAILDQILDGRHKIIDASAGTGKTFTIEQIVIELLRTGAAELFRVRGRHPKNRGHLAGELRNSRNRVRRGLHSVA